jgi:hypothetical protein
MKIITASDEEFELLLEAFDLAASYLHIDYWNGHEKDQVRQHAVEALKERILGQVGRTE